MCNYKSEEFFFEEEWVSFHNCQEPALDGDPDGLCIFHSKLDWDKKPDFHKKLEEYNARQPMKIELVDEKRVRISLLKSVYNYIGFNFPGATFGNHILFSSATFGNQTSFSDATFGRSADFFRTTFGDQTYFVGATFGNGTKFHFATFGNQT